MQGAPGEDGRRLASVAGAVEGLLSYRGRSALALLLLAALVLAGLKALQAYELASHDKFDTYVSDEVWYVTSARTILYDILGLAPRYEVNGSLAYTVFTTDTDTLERVRGHVEQVGGLVLKDDYREARAIAVALPPGAGGVNVLEDIPGVTKVVPGYPYADKKDIDRYYNLEHPPLGKYIIGLSMYLLGDRPLSWRVPGIIEAGLIVIIAALAGYLLVGLGGGLLAALAAYYDPLTTRLASVAMLDIHLAFFTALAGLSLAYSKPRMALLFTALAGMVKYSGLFILPAIYVALRFRGYPPLRALMTILFPLVAVSVPVYLPYLMYFGPGRMISEFVNALKWHTTSRPEGPATSTPLDWVLGWSPFYLHLDPDVPARGSPVVYVPVFATLVLLSPLLFSRRLRRRLDEGASDILLAIGSFMVGFALVFIMGNRTLYSFYMTQAAPLFYQALPVAVVVLFLRSQLVSASLSLAREVARTWALGGLGLYRPPRELVFLWRLLFWEPFRRRVLFWLVVTVAAFSLVAHWDVGQEVKLFSDARWMAWREGALSTEPGRLVGAQGALSFLFAALGVSGDYLLLLDFAGLLLFANEARILMAHMEARGGRPRLFFYPLLLTLAIYGAYDGSGVSLFLFTLGLNLWLEGNSLAAGISMGLAAGNPFMLVFTPLFLALRDRMALAGFALASLTLASFLSMALGPGEWLRGLALFLDTPKTVGVGLLLPYKQYTYPALLVISLLLALYVSSKIRCRVSSMAASLLVASALFPNVLPQWLVFLAPLVLVLGRSQLIPLLTMDVANSLVVFLWFSSTELMKQLFKLETQGALDPLSAPALASYLRALALLLIAYRMVALRGGSIERCESPKTAGRGKGSGGHGEG